MSKFYIQTILSTNEVETTIRLVQLDAKPLESVVKVYTNPPKDDPDFKVWPPVIGTTLDKMPPEKVPTPPTPPEANSDMVLPGMQSAPTPPAASSAPTPTPAPTEESSTAKKK